MSRTKSNHQHSLKKFNEQCDFIKLIYEMANSDGDITINTNIYEHYNESLMKRCKYCDRIPGSFNTKFDIIRIKNDENLIKNIMGVFDSMKKQLNKLVDCDDCKPNYYLTDIQFEERYNGGICRFTWSEKDEEEFEIDLIKHDSESAISDPE